MSIEAGTHLGRYEIRSSLGAGGMGEVYLAQDTKLRRPVALKLLPAKFTADEDRLRRFEQEACAASALNHPNIITIHEIGQEDSVHFMATEFVEGETLHHRLKRKPLRLREALDIAVQVADALKMAHAAGIVHRDIKPENIMLRTDGYVKVLDFGLAKLTTNQFLTTDTQAPTLPKVDTDPGTVMGTAKYMSPEQARGQDVDARTDIWSLGVVLYEMVTGRAPFEGATSSHVIVNLLEKEPASLSTYLQDAPAELQRIIRKALRKDREERYQTINDLLVDLKSLRQELEIDARLEQSSSPHLSVEPGVTRSSGIIAAAADTLKDSRSRTVTEATHTASSAEYLVSEIKRHKKGTALALLGLCAIIAGVVYLSIFFKPVATKKPVTFLQNMQVTQLTTSGKSLDAVISPDGKYVAHVIDDGSKQSLWVRQVATASNVPIVPPAEVTYQGVAFSPDTTFIYFNMWDRQSVGAIYQVPVVGGAAPRKVINDVLGGISISPDSKRIACVRGYAKENAAALIVANTDGSNEKILSTTKGSDGVFGGAWSPDGKRLAVVFWNDSTKTLSLVEIPAEGGAQKQITAQKWTGIGNLEWLGDGSGLVMSASDQRRSPAQIWFISYPDGEARKITSDLNGYNVISLTADSSTLVTVRGNGLSNIWTMNGEDREHVRQVTSGNTEGANGFAWTPDGHLVYSSVASGNWDIWIMQPDGSGQKQLTFDAHANRLPTVSPDGRYVVFVSDRTGTDQIWRMNMDGSDPKQLTNVDGDTAPNVTPDSQWVLYNSVSAGKPSIWKVSIGGGEPVQVTDTQTPFPAVSPDGKLIACSYWDEQSNPQQWRIAILSYTDGRIVKTFETPRTAVNGAGSVMLRWTPDGRSLAFVDNRNGSSNVWSLPVDGGAAKQWTDFKSDTIFFFDWSRDGRQLATARGHWTSDVYLIKGFK
ncbi:MAG: protein kinase [Pyrinomonadaceae bacterium]